MNNEKHTMVIEQTEPTSRKSITHLNVKEKIKKLLPVLYSLVAVSILIIAFLLEFYKFLAVFIIILMALPFVFLFIKKAKYWNFGEPYTSVLSSKFITAWIAFWGVIGAAIGIIQIQTQVNIQQKQLRDTRFSSGVELLGNEKESARIGGVYNLYFLANEHPQEYLESACEILCSHIRTITREKDYQEKHIEKPSNEVQTVINLLFKKDRNNKLIFDDCNKNFKDAFLCGSDFTKALINNTFFESSILNNSDFSYSMLIKNVYFKSSELRSVNFGHSVLKNISFFSNQLNDIDFFKANLNNVDFSHRALKFDIFRKPLPKPKNDDFIFFDIDSKPPYTIDDLYFMEATLKNVDFSYIILNNFYFATATLEDVFFKNSTLNNASFCIGLGALKATLNNVDFESSSLNDIVFGENTLKNVSFQNAKLNCVTFWTARLYDADFQKTTFNQIDFTCSKFYNVNFKESTFSNDKSFEPFDFSMVFWNTEFVNVDFSSSKLELKKDAFYGTLFENYTYEEITKPGWSFELSNAKNKKNGMKRKD